MQVTLTGRVALVTGAARGIGRAIAVGLARAGAAVCVNYRQHHERAKETLAAIEAAGGHGVAHQADVSDRAQTEALVGAVVERAGRLDILVTTAGISREGLFVQTSDPDNRVSWLTVRPLLDPDGFARSITQLKLTAGIKDVVFGVSSSRTAFRVLKLKPVLKVIESPVHRLLLAD